MKQPKENEACQRYLEEPESNEAHLQTCAECKSLQEALAGETSVKPLSLDVESLPLAPWEDASHRPWPLVLGGIAILVTAALALCDAAGLSPLHVAENSLTSMETMRGLVNSANSWLRRAPLGMQVIFGAAFVLFNALLIVLLRRAPRGMDA